MTRGAALTHPATLSPPRGAGGFVGQSPSPADGGTPHPRGRSGEGALPPAPGTSRPDPGATCIHAAHFGLQSNPFSLTPDPAFLYPSPGHAEALAALQVGLLDRRGLLVMTGEVGTGKTTLLYSLLSEIGAGVHTAYISNTRMAVDDILRQALADFGVAAEATDRLALLRALNDFLRGCSAAGTTAAIIVDEAQNLSDEAFEDIRLLSNFETFSTKLLQIVLVGQPELDTRLRQPHLRQIAERVAVHCRIDPLTAGEARQYIAHRLERAGGHVDLFTPEALRRVVRASRGLPRRINIISHNALLFAYGRGAPRVLASHVAAAMREHAAVRPSLLGLLADSRRRAALAAVAALVALVALAAAWRSPAPSPPSSATRSPRALELSPEPFRHARVGPAPGSDAPSAVILPPRAAGLDIEPVFHARRGEDLP